MGSLSLYQLGPALVTIGRLLDLGRIGDAGPPLAVNLTDLKTGAPVVVDSASAELRPEHLLASMGLLPDFPPTEIDGRWFRDSGFSASLPLHAVLDPPPETDVGVRFSPTSQILRNCAGGFKLTAKRGR